MIDENVEEIQKRLLNIQEELDNEYIEYTKRDFELKLSHYTQIKPILDQRDLIFADLKNPWELCFLNYEMGCELLPIDKNNKVIADFIENIKVWYEENYFCCVEISFTDTNPYFSNKKLLKKFSVLSEETENTKINWTEKINAPIFQFFEEEEDILETFDVLYEMYVNAIFYLSLAEELESQ
ncbi:hypothetical protein CWI38_2480p0010 [Hamiltosporidium tvaerminnensis]|uniref:Nucleosome assembly protein n=2 Tax=Hamiltosporidium TaxID=1176354 RepID=A0A4Q9LHJ1_9MICR|nr:hypothetical protein CWI37_2196p0010 [Hamiltosporidium tvaerminnensis]TBT99063.1 hypothetical protein CWI36_2116p0020 [Hamiltosporidium magnivora]TBU06945.1 hypothetical protein CWI38_2480p0010 [Hamiltosporidium tvaerminnensis]